MQLEFVQANVEGCPPIGSAYENVAFRDLVDDVVGATVWFSQEKPCLNASAEAGKEL